MVQELTTPSAKALGHTARLNPKETPVDVFSELLRFAKVEAVDGQGPECFCQDVLEPDTKCLYCRATIAISQLWKERNSHYQLLSALKGVTQSLRIWMDEFAREYPQARELSPSTSRVIECAEEVITKAEGAL